MEIIKYLIGASGISTIIIFLSKWLIKYIGNLGLEQYKSELQKEELKIKHKFELEIEKYRSELSKLNLEFQIKLSKLYVDQFEIIKQIYKKLIQAEKPLEYLLRPVKINPVKTEDEIANEVLEKANDFFNYFDENEILLKEETAKLISNIRSLYYKVWSTFSRKQFMGESISGEMSVRLIEEMNKAYKEILQGEMQTLKKKLKEDFRTQIGIIEEKLVPTTTISNAGESDKIERYEH